MSRIRTIKPEFFKNFDLYKAEIESKLPLRVAYSGLWTACDREGRFKWKPEELKLDCLPYDSIEFSHVLDALWNRGYIDKYISENKIFGFIPSWKEHQYINNRESESILPNPYECSIVTRDGRVTDALEDCTSGKERKGRGKEGERKDAVEIKIFAIEDETFRNELMKYFGFNELTHFNQFREITLFLNIIRESQRLDHFLTQFTYYQKHREAAKIHKHNLKTFLGSIEQKYEDGAWNAENWKMKLNEVSINGKPQETFILKSRKEAI